MGTYGNATVCALITAFAVGHPHEAPDALVPADLRRLEHIEVSSLTAVERAWGGAAELRNVTSMPLSTASRFW